METKVYDILNMGMIDFIKSEKIRIETENSYTRRSASDNNYITPDMIDKAIKRLSKRIEREKPYYIEVENTIEKTDFL